MPELISKTQSKVSQGKLTGSLPSHLIFADLHREQAATGRLTLSKGVSKTMGISIADCGLNGFYAWSVRTLFRLEAGAYGTDSVGQVAAGDDCLRTKEEGYLNGESEAADDVKSSCQG